MENEFPPNSHSRKEARQEPRPERAPEKREVRRVTTGKVTIRKKSLWKKFLDAFRPEDNVGFIEHTVLDVLVPGIKDAAADAIHGTIDNALGTTHHTRRHRRGRDERVSYNRMSEARPRSRREREREDDRRGSRRERYADDVREVIFPTRVEAEETLDTLIELASKYDTATMRDLLSAIGEPHNPTHEDWGWSDFRGARIHRISGGYLLDLPRPEYLD